MKIDEAQRVASILKTFVHPQKISSPYEGNLQLLDDGGVVVGWGGVRKVTEFSPAGKVRFELKLPYGDTWRLRGRLVLREETEVWPRLS